MKLMVRYINPEAGGIDLLKICQQPDNALTETACIMKDDGTTTLRYLKSDIGELVVKRYNTKNWWHLIRRNFQTSRATNNLRMARLFKAKKIEVPEPLAVIESRWGYISGRSWYVCRYAENVLLLDYLNDDNWLERFNIIVDKVVNFFLILINNDLSHGDMKATNLLVQDGSLVIIDLDSAKQHRIAYGHRLALQRDKERFLNNWNARPDLRNSFAIKLAEIGL